MLMQEFRIIGCGQVVFFAFLSGFTGEPCVPAAGHLYMLSKA